MIAASEPVLQDGLKKHATIETASGAKESRETEPRPAEATTPAAAGSEHVPAQTGAAEPPRKGAHEAPPSVPVRAESAPERTDGDVEGVIALARKQEQQALLERVITENNQRLTQLKNARAEIGRTSERLTLAEDALDRTIREAFQKHPTQIRQALHAAVEKKGIDQTLSDLRSFPTRFGALTETATDPQAAASLATAPAEHYLRNHEAHGKTGNRIREQLKLPPTLSDRQVTEYCQKGIRECDARGAEAKRELLTLQKDSPAKVLTKRYNDLSPADQERVRLQVPGIEGVVRAGKTGISLAEGKNPHEKGPGR